MFLDGSSPNDICELVSRKNVKIIKVVTRSIVALKLNSQRGVYGSDNFEHSPITFEFLRTVTVILNFLISQFFFA